MELTELKRNYERFAVNRQYVYDYTHRRRR